MPKYDMVDLLGQYRKIQTEVDAGIREVLESTRYIGGEKVSGFEEELATYLACHEVISCANGTDALQIALMALDLPAGAEVITTPFTFAATVEVAALLGFKPVMADIDPKTFNLDPEATEAAITEKTACIVPVNLFGQPADLEAFKKLSEKYDIPVVEDNAQAIGADFTFSDGTEVKAGTVGQIGTTSFFPSKNLGCYGDGGAINSDSVELAARCRSIANHGSARRYHYDDVGVNSRLDAIQAAVLRVKLPNLDRYNAARIEAASRYDDLLRQVDWLETPYRAPNVKHVFHQYTLRVTNGKRDQVVDHLQQNGVACAVYYPIPLHLQKAYKHYGYTEGQFSHSETACEEVVSLPMHSELTEDQQQQITDILKGAL